MFIGISTMIHKKFLILILFPFFLFSQGTEKRLALIIGNSNYDKGELKNPVNDANLIAQTLDSLNFDVILKENIETRSQFIRAIREFGNQRPDYDVAFVYYAGHGIQVDDENFLLPTKEEFTSEEDVLDYAVSIQNIMRYLKAQTNEVNILILDACRDNPFESNWNATRSLKGEGLAKIPPPTGSLIAFSTDSGQTAPDGDGENSIYSISLSKNMLLEDTSIDQVFRNVRTEVLTQTNGMQRPVEATQLTGQGFYLLRKNYELMLDDVWSLMDEKKYLSAIEMLSGIMPYLKNSAEAFYIRAVCYVRLEKYSESLIDFNKSLEIDSLFTRSLYGKGLLLINHFDNHNELERVLKKYIEIESNLEDPEFSRLTSAFGILEDSYINNNYDNEIILKMWNDALLKFPNIASLYFKRALFSSNVLKDHQNANEDYFRVIELNGDAAAAYNNLATYYKNNNDYDKSLIFYKKAIDIDPENDLIYSRLAQLQNNFMGQNMEAIINISKAIEIDPDYPYHYYVLATLFEANNKFFNSFKSISKAILLDPDNFLWFETRGKYNYKLGDYDSAILDYTKAIDLYKINFGKIDEFTGWKFDRDYGGFLSDLFVERGKIFKEMNAIGDSCNDYYYALEILVKDSFYTRDEIENLILNNCN